MLNQPRTGQAYDLPLSAVADERTTHVAVHKQQGFKYFCRFDPEALNPEDGIPPEDVKGTYYATACQLYGSCYNGCSLWQGGFDFYTLAEWVVDGRGDGVVGVDNGPELPADQLAQLAALQQRADQLERAIDAILVAIVDAVSGPSVSGSLGADLLREALCKAITSLDWKKPR